MKEKKDNSKNKKKVDDTQTSNTKVVKWIIGSIVLVIIVFVIMILLGIIPGSQEEKFDGCYKLDDESTNLSLCLIGNKAELSDVSGLNNFNVVKSEDEDNIYIKKNDSTKFICQISSDSNSQLECVNKIDDSTVLSYNKTYYFNKLADSPDIKNGKFRTLYKYSIEDFDYSLLYKMYKYDYTNVPNTVGRNGKVIITLEGDNCLFTQQEQIDDQFDTYYSATSTSCSYSIDNNKVSISGAINSITTYKPDPLSSKTESFSKTDTLDLTGEIIDNGKYLQIGDTKYYQVDYMACLNNFNGYDEIYYNPDSNRLYDSYGIAIYDSNYKAIEEGSEIQKIDLSMYNIVDKTSKNKANTDNSEKKQEKNNDVKNESTKTNEKVRYSKKDYKYTNLSKLTYSQYEELYNSNKPFVVILTQSTCNYSKQYIPVIKKYVNKENVPVYILEIDSMGKEDTKKVISSLSYFEDNDTWGTPLTLAIKDKAVVNDLVGFTDEQSEFDDFFKSIYG